MLALLVLVLHLLEVSSRCLFAQHYGHLYDKAITALSNEHIVLMGDSLMRYHYLSLVFLLRYDHVLLPDMNPNPINEHQWFTWPYFLRSTTMMLAPFEHCDCYRESILLDAWENRYYHDPIHNISITFILFQYGTTRGAWYPNHWKEDTLPASVNLASHVTTTQTMTFQEATEKGLLSFNPYISDGDTDYIIRRNLKPSWDYRFNDTIVNIVQYLTPKPRILIANIGIWHLSYESELEDLYHAAKQIFPFFIWKKTAARRERQDEHNHRNLYNEWDNFVCGKSDVICHDLFWTHEFPSECWIDGAHFVASIYYRIIDESLDLIAKAIESVTDHLKIRIKEGSTD